jgi:hypothetical protein
MRSTRATAWFAGIGFSLASLTGVAPALAQARKPASATAQCKDGSYSTAKTERGACSSHGGVATWYGTPKSQPKTTTAPAGKATTNAVTSKDNPPANATGQCKDGTYTTAASKRGACSGHGGVFTWIAGNTTSAPTPPRASNTPTTAVRPQPPAATPPPAAPVNRPTNTTSIQAPPAGAPANATAQCNDGTFSFARQHRGACSGHKGVKAWFK